MAGLCRQRLLGKSDAEYIVHIACEGKDNYRRTLTAVFAMTLYASTTIWISAGLGTLNMVTRRMTLPDMMASCGGWY